MHERRRDVDEDGDHPAGRRPRVAATSFRSPRSRALPLASAPSPARRAREKVSERDGLDARPEEESPSAGEGSEDVLEDEALPRGVPHGMPEKVVGGGDAEERVGDPGVAGTSGRTPRATRSSPRPSRRGRSWGSRHGARSRRTISPAWRATNASGSVRFAASEGRSPTAAASPAPAQDVRVEPLRQELTVAGVEA